MRNILLTIFLLSSLITVADKKKNKKSTQSQATNAASSSQTNDADNKTNTTKNSGVKTATGSDRPRLKTTKEGAELVSFEMTDLQKNKITNADIGDENVILVLFNPDCGHCVEVGKQVRENIENFSNTKIFFLTGETVASFIPEYVSTSELPIDNKTIYIGGISKELTDMIFDYKGIPQIMVYNKEKILQRVYHQDVNWEEVIAILNK